MKRFLIILLCTLCIFSAGCSGGDPSIVRASEDFLAKANEVVVTEDSVIFTDALSDEPVEIAKSPETVVCMYASYATLWYEAGGSLIGCIGGDSASELYTEYIGRDITNDSGMTVLATTAAGKNWDIEKLIALNPSLVLCSTAMNGHSTLDAPLKAAGIPLVAVDYDNFSDYLKWFKVFCNLTGHPELWESVALKAYDEVMSVLEKVPETDAPPRVFPMFAGTSSLKANTSLTVPGEMLLQLGAVNIADETGTSEAERLDINLETVYAADPDMILIQCHAGTDLAVSRVNETYGGNAVWNSLNAIKNGRVYYLDKTLFHNKPNSRFAEAYRMLAELLYPDVNF